MRKSKTFYCSGSWVSMSHEDVRKYNLVHVLKVILDETSWKRIWMTNVSVKIEKDAFIKELEPLFTNMGIQVSLKEIADRSKIRRRADYRVDLLLDPLKHGDIMFIDGIKYKGYGIAQERDGKTHILLENGRYYTATQSSVWYAKNRVDPSVVPIDILKMLQRYAGDKLTPRIHQIIAVFDLPVQPSLRLYMQNKRAVEKVSGERVEFVFEANERQYVQFRHWCEGKRSRWEYKPPRWKNNVTCRYQTIR